MTRVVRTLKGKGDFIVRVGQEVMPAEIIGSATFSSGFRTLNLSSLLSVPPAQAEKYLKRRIGEKIYKGELLALKQGWLAGKMVITSPTDGVLELVNNRTGELKISFLPKKVDLPAGVYGVVEGINPEKGQVIIRTEVSRVHGVCGSGRSRDGSLHVLGEKDDLISENKLEANYDGQVLVGGSFIYKDGISAAISSEVSGIITGGISAEDYKGIAGGYLAFPKKFPNDIGVSIVVCEGFGSIPMGQDIFGFLAEYEGKFVFIDGDKATITLPSLISSSLTKVKNTKLPPFQADDLSAGLDQVLAASELGVGFNVRVVGSSYCGEQGKVLAIDDSLTLLPSRVRAYLATVETKTRKIRVPVANLEIIM
ncbi:MAG: hypothetical protein M1142_04505 [Patescibacteria group bacterium]|nr:hypothetical protein [Patescibacteria group bacterium]